MKDENLEREFRLKIIQIGLGLSDEELAQRVKNASAKWVKSTLEKRGRNLVPKNKQKPPAKTKKAHESLKNRVEQESIEKHCNNDQKDPILLICKNPDCKNDFHEYKNKKYCSIKCQRAVSGHKSGYEPQKKPPRKKIPCANLNCEELFLEHHSKKFCSPECRTDHYRKMNPKKPTMRECKLPSCKNLFIAHAGNHSYCSPECNKKNLKKITSKFFNCYRCQVEKNKETGYIAFSDGQCLCVKCATKLNYLPLFSHPLDV